MPTYNELAQQIVTDTRPGGPDGASNLDRFAFVCEVFEVESLDLDADFDFGNINACDDLDMVEACRHFAVLQMQYLKEMADYGMIEPIAADVKSTYLILTIQRINWHLQHLGMGRRTPPFPALN